MICLVSSADLVYFFVKGFLLKSLTFLRWRSSFHIYGETRVLTEQFGLTIVLSISACSGKIGFFSFFPCGDRLSVLYLECATGNVLTR